MPTARQQLTRLPVKENKPLGSIIKDQFASNTPEDVAVMLRPLTESLAFGNIIAKAIGCISSLRCKITRLGKNQVEDPIAPKRNSNNRTNH